MAYSAEEIENIKTVIAVGKAKGAPNLAMLAILCIGAGENHFSRYGCNSSNHCGFFQLSGSLQSEHDYHDVSYWAARAYDSGFWSHGGIIPMARNDPGLSPGWIANACQGAYANLQQGADYYNQYRGEALVLLNQYGDVPAGSISPASAPGPSSSGSQSLPSFTGNYAYLVPQINFAGNVDNVGQMIFDRGNDARNNSRATREHVTNVHTIGWT